MNRKTENVKRMDPSPLYHQIYLYILNTVIPATPIGQTLPTDNDVAEMMSVSRGTVRLAFNKLEQDGIINRIPGKGTFLNEDFFIRLKKYRVGLVLPSQEFSHEDILIQNWVHHMEIINGIFSSCIALNVSCSLFPEEAMGALINSEYDGFIMYPGLAKENVDRIARPSVLLEYDMDFLQGFELLARHAARAGYKKIAFLGRSAERRIETIRAILHEEVQGLTVAEENVFRCEGSMKDGYNMCVELLAKGADVDCIICSNDLRAIGVLKCLEEKGIKVPDQIAVYGLDGIRQSERTSPPLTSCHFDWQYPGRTALSQIRAILDKRTPMEYTRPKGRLIERASTRTGINMEK